MNKIGIFFDDLCKNLEHPKSFWSVVMDVSILAGIVLAFVGILYAEIQILLRAPFVIKFISSIIVTIFVISGLVWFSRDD